MITETSTISITATFNEERTHRYTLRREWDSTKKSACIIMSNSSNADVMRGDLTSLLIQNNLSALGYGAVIAVNLFSYRCTKLDLSKDVDITELTNTDNEQQIVQAVKDSDITILAIGTLCKTYKRAVPYQNRLHDLLRDYQDKVHVIAAPCGTEGLHPLSGKLRADGSWSLVKYKLPDPPLPNEDTKDLNADKGGSGTSSNKGKKQGKQEGKVIPLTT